MAPKNFVPFLTLLLLLLPFFFLHWSLWLLFFTKEFVDLCGTYSFIEIKNFGGKGYG